MIPHINPDGDTLGSAFGLRRVLLNAGIESVVISPDYFPSYLNWLGNNTKSLIYRKNEKVCNQLIDEADVLFFLDFNDLKRLGNLADYLGKISKLIVLIDHHPDPEIKVNWSFSDINVSSTAELVYNFLEETSLIGFLDKESSELLLTGIMADT